MGSSNFYQLFRHLWSTFHLVVTAQKCQHTHWPREGEVYSGSTPSITMCCYIVSRVTSQSLRLITANSTALTTSLPPRCLIPTFLHPSSLTNPVSTPRAAPIRAHPHLLNPLLDHFNLHLNWPRDSLALLKGRLFVVLCG